MSNDMRPMTAGGDVFGVNDSPLFDSAQHTQGGNPHILQYLFQEFAKHVAAQIEERKKNKKPTVELSAAMAKMPMTRFLTWAKQHLTEVRPVNTFFLDENIGVRLSNNRNIAISPGIEIRGTMQNAGAVAVTRGASQEGNEGVVQTDDFSI